MTISRAAAAGLMMAMLAGAAAAAPELTPTKISKTDRTLINACVAMQPEEMMKNDGCRLMMKKMKLSGDDMKIMAACSAMTKNELMKDKQCLAFNSAHPGMMP